MVDELLEAYKRINALEGDITVLTYRIDKMDELIDKIVTQGQITAKDSVNKCPLNKLIDDGR